MLLYVFDWCLILFQKLSNSLVLRSLRLDDAEAINRAVLLFLASIIGLLFPLITGLETSFDLICSK